MENPQIPEKVKGLQDSDYLPPWIILNQLIDWAHSVEERLSNQAVEKPEVFSFQADRPLNSERE